MQYIGIEETHQVVVHGGELEKHADADQAHAMQGLNLAVFGQNLKHIQTGQISDFNMDLVFNSMHFSNNLVDQEINYGACTIDILFTR